MIFFDRFREAAAHLPAGLIRTGPPADPGAIAAVSAALGRALPEPFVSFLRSFDGADLFHESVVVAGVGPASPQRILDLNPDRPAVEPAFAEAMGGDRFVFDAAGRVLRLRGDERWLAGTDFPGWLDARVAHARPLYGTDGEFSPDAFEPDGGEVVPVVALRQAERALRLDPGSADLHHERGVALRRLGHAGKAEAAFERATTLDPGNPWPWFDLGRAALGRGAGGARQALAAFRRAAERDAGPAGARLLIWAARAALVAALPEEVDACRREALARAPALADELARAAGAARADGEPGAIAEAEALLAALAGTIPPGRARLPVVATPEAVAAIPTPRRTRPRRARRHR